MPTSEPAQPNVNDLPDPDEPGIDDAERQRRTQAREQAQRQADQNR